MYKDICSRSCHDISSLDINTHSFTYFTVNVHRNLHVDPSALNTTALHKPEFRNTKCYLPCHNILKQLATFSQQVEKIKYPCTIMESRRTSLFMNLEAFRRICNSIQWFKPKCVTIKAQRNRYSKGTVSNKDVINCRLRCSYIQPHSARIIG